MAAVFLARECAASPVTQLAQSFGPVSVSAISKLLNRAALRRHHDRKWDRLLGTIERGLETVAQKPNVKT
jgi:hypothetical protein